MVPAGQMLCRVFRLFPHRQQFLSRGRYHAVIRLQLFSLVLSYEVSDESEEGFVGCGDYVLPVVLRRVVVFVCIAFFVFQEYARQLLLPAGALSRRLHFEKKPDDPGSGLL